jgi:alpha-mannosidase
LLDNNKGKKVHMIGNAHIDPVWMWRWQEGYQEVRATFETALQRIEEDPEFIFTCSSAALYKWIEESEPSMFERIKKYVAEGKWCIAGGWWIEPDCNIPSGEALVRQGLYGQRYYVKNCAF